jgi:RNA polymerase sigma-70 factor, ECF subfamily
MAAEPHISSLDLDLVSLRIPSSARPIAKDELSMDEATFRALYEQTSRPLFSYLLRVSGRRDLAEDLLQEAYCRILSSKLPPLDETQRRSYLFRTATNLLRDSWRRHKEHPLPDDLPEVAASGPHPNLRIGMRQAFQELKDRDRQLLWLAYVEGSSHKEIADATGLKAGSIRLLLFRARRKLADLINLSSTDRGRARI